MNGEADDDNGNDDDDNTVQDVIQVENVIHDTNNDVDESFIYEETINNDFTVPEG